MIWVVLGVSRFEGWYDGQRRSNGGVDHVEPGLWLEQYSGGNYTTLSILRDRDTLNP